MTITHRKTRTPEYRSWAAAKARCVCPTNSRFNHYGARGIKFCQRWADSFESFLSDMGLKPSPKHEIDRIDNDGDYEPGNCQWATRSQQVRNTRVTKLSEALVSDLRAWVKAGGQVRQWAADHGIKEQTAYNVTSRGAWR